MSVLPNTPIEQIQFCEAHNPVWTAAPTTMGLTAAQCTALTTATTAARKAFNDAQAAREASKAFTTTLHGQVTTMKNQVSDLIRQIKAFAELQSNPATVYAAAQIPPPAAPTPLAAPGKPTDFEVVLNSDGSVTLSWTSIDSAASTGAFFAISRKLPGQSSFVGIGGAPGSTTDSRRPSFTDATVPAAAASAGAQYIVQGFRGTRMGDACEAITVQFGTDGLTITSATGATFKMAA